MSRKQAQLLDRLVADKTLSRAGRSFLTAALDPFHDTEIAIDGFPDITSSRSVVQVLQYVKTITKPPSLPPGDWDCNIFNTPTSYNDNDGNGKLYPTGYYKSGGIASITGGQNIGTGLAAFATPPGGGFTDSSAVDVSDGLAMPAQYSSGRHRLFGMGYEVVNATSAMYKQGSVTVYKKPSNILPTVVHEVDKTDPNTPTSPSRYSLFGATGVLTAGDAASYPNSKTWAAAEGVYAIATLNDVNCPVVEAMPRHVFLSCSNTFNPPPTYYQFGYGTLPSDEASVCLYPFDVTGSVFTGLSEQTALTITVRYFVERFPEQDNRDLIVLARPSPAYDPFALELYARCLEHLPIACMVKDNPLGEWFGKVLQTVGKIAPVVGSFIPGLGPIIGNAVGTVATAVGDRLSQGSGQAQSTPPPTIQASRPPPRPPVLRASPLANHTTLRYVRARQRAVLKRTNARQALSARPPRKK